MSADMKWESIVELEGEIKLIGKKEEDKWSFAKIESKDLSKKTTSEWTEAVWSLGENWQHFMAKYVHPDFRDKIWEEVIDVGLTKKKRQNWMLVCNAPLLQAAQLLKRSSSTIVFTGAGMSTESGIPDFRSISGWWKQIDPRTVATVEALQHHYELFHELYSRRIRALQDIEPHEGHKVLAEWEDKGLVHLIATQNVDRLHQQAGSQHVEELHGSITSIRCHRCEQEGPLSNF
jgi:hypothetical protein